MDRKVRADRKTRLTLNQARHHPLFQREDGSYPDLSTLHRWAFRGVRGVKLGIIRVGGRILTTPSLILEFDERLNAGRMPDGSPARRAEIDAARRRLDLEGI
jgi:hypothetical protein